MPKQVHRIRISGGVARGRMIFVPSGLALRPTAARVRSALFDVLSYQIVGASFLDLYAGTGAVGIEAISRGAHRACFVEQDDLHLKNLKNNLELCCFPDKSEVVAGTASNFLKHLQRPFDIIFVDPPYAGEEIENILISLKQGDMMSPDGRLVFEHQHKRVLPKEIGVLQLEKQYRYGGTVLSFYGKS